MKTLTPFRQQLSANIQATVSRWLADGTVGASVPCLLQGVRTPPSHLDGAPRGTNAPYYYRQLFRETLAATKLPAGFEILPD